MLSCPALISHFCVSALYVVLCSVVCCTGPGEMTFYHNVYKLYRGMSIKNPLVLTWLLYFHWYQHSGTILTLHGSIVTPKKSVNFHHYIKKKSMLNELSLSAWIVCHVCSHSLLCDISLRVAWRMLHILRRKTI